MGKTQIDWPGLTDTWNVQTGCPRGCQYCVVRKRVWPRIKHHYGGHDYSKVVFHYDKLFEYEGTKNKVIFVNFFSDIEYSTREQMLMVIKKCRENNQNKYLFLSKNSRVYDGYDWPDNTMQGLTVTIPSDTLEWIKIDDMAICIRPFLSIEPIMGPIKYDIPKNIELVIVGAMTGCGKNNVVPKREWIQSIKDHVPVKKIHWKKNILEYL